LLVAVYLFIYFFFYSQRKTKYLLVSLTALGYLRIEDDRGNGVVYGAEVKSVNFLNGARHSVYYKRNGANAILLVGRLFDVLLTSPPTCCLFP
jgi:hypothetical protein